MHPVLKVMNGDKALSLAYLTSAIAANVLSDNVEDRSAASLAWPAMQSTADTETEVAAAKAARDVLAPFVRANVGAPAEALYIHAGDTRIRPADAERWADLPMPWLFAYGFFSTALIYADKVLADEKAMKEAANAKPPAAALSTENYTHAEDDRMGLVDVPRGYKPAPVTPAVEPDEGESVLQGRAPAKPKPPMAPNKPAKKTKKRR